MVLCPATGKACQRSCEDAFCKIEAMAGRDVTALLSPPASTPAQHEARRIPSDFFLVVFPDTDLHHKLAARLSGAKHGQLIPLTNDEMALLSEFIVWPKQPPTVSF